MKYKTIAIAAALLAAVSGWAPASRAASLSAVFEVADRIVREGRASQAKIDKLTDQTRDLLAEYKTVMKEVEGLRVYNRQLERQIAKQEQEMAQLNDSIDQVTLASLDKDATVAPAPDVTVIERQITPLMIRMIDGLDQFIELDVPFSLDERRERIENLRDLMDSPDVTPSEKFSQVLNAYQIETAYGRTMEAYTGELEGRVVDFLRVGRIVLAYQSQDGAESGAWNQSTHSWEKLPDSYSSSIRNGIRMARQQMSVDLLTLPVPGPEQASN